MQAIKSNKEGEAWNSPWASELLVPTGVTVDRTGEERNQREIGACKKEAGFSQKLWIVLLVAVLTALTASQALQWVKIKDGERCPHLLNDQPPPTTNKGTAPAPSKVLEAIHGIDTSEHEPVQRQKRNIPEQLYISLDQYLEEQAVLRTEMRRMTNHPAARFTLRGYISDHEMETQTNFHWESVDEQSMFTLTPAGVGRDLQVQTSGYYHLSFSVMFNGRKHWQHNRSPACSLKVGAKPSIQSTNQNDHNTLLYLSRTQAGNGRRIHSNTWPIDTAQASGVFLLRQGDVIYVRPGTFSLGCKIYTSSYKTHLDAFLISSVTA